MSFYEQFILDLQAHVKVTVPEFRFIDQNLGQWGDENFRTSVSFPAILVDFPSTTYSEISSGSQLGLTNIELTLLFQTASQSYNLAQDAVKIKALDYYKLEAKLVANLQNWSKDYFQGLIRVNAQSKNRNELGLRIRELNFTTEFEEYLEDETAEEVEFTIAINGQIQQTNPAD
ncbi:MAG: hypothetical protein C0525_01435 [Flavobacterium sp.]|uniref:hypothetical protein n=1 Tax=Flavobacterium sp. TaxID=239 RepID=UPI0025B93B7E|nr:hypothetical protein [Flavobacterium sp.]MBA4133363.1 hypothetical protein [Flavobacterium sp.]